MASDSRRFTRAPNLEVYESDDGLIVHNPATDSVHHLNYSAGALFELCQGTQDEDSLARKMAELYSLEEPPVDATREGLVRLLEQGVLIEVADD